MCFSAEVSFGAVAVIGTVGVIAYKKSETKAQKAFAFIPLIFCLQQVSEGFLWIVLENPDFIRWKTFLTFSFLGFAWFVWPLFIPIVCRSLETKPRRKLVLSWFVAIGAFVVCILLVTMFFIPVDASISCYHIDYTIQLHWSIPMFFTLMYVTPTVVSLLVSSVRYMWVLGVVNLLSYLFTKIYFAGQLISVWCFFGAISSVFVLLIIIRMNKRKVN